MTEERITETETPTGNVHTTHTVVTDDGRRGGGSGWLIVLLVLVVAVVGIWFLTQMGGAETAKDNAIADAAQDVGAAANQVGDAAQDAVQN